MRLTRYPIQTGRASAASRTTCHYRTPRLRVIYNAPVPGAGGNQSVRTLVVLGERKGKQAPLHGISA
jgi:hypothetical protein